MTALTRRRPASVIALLVAVLTGMLLAAFVATPAAHAATADPAVVAQSLKSDPLYVAPGAENILNNAGQDQVRAALRDVKKNPTFLMVLPADALPANGKEQARFVEDVRNNLGRPGTYGLVVGRHFGAASDVLATGQAGRLVKEAIAQNRNDVAGGLVDFVKLVDKAPQQAPGGSAPRDEPGGSGGGAGAVLLGLLAVLVLGGVGIFAWTRKRRRDREARELAEVRQATEEDVTRLGEEITALDLDVADPKLPGETREDYRHALDSYDGAKAALEAAKRPADMRKVTEALEDGRYYLACVRARLDGRPLPERRPPCFFNPQHGPSVEDVTWAPIGGAPREVPACAADAERVRHGEDPESRLVPVGGVRRPYWEAGPGYAPYAGGYYSGMGDMFTGMLVGTMLGSALSGGWGHGGYDAGYAAGYDAGQDVGNGGDFGGGDFGDFGGGDFGGGDFGGGDFGGGDW